MLQRRIAYAVAAIAHQVAVPVTPLVYPALALDQFINQFVAFVRIGVSDEGFKLIGSRDAPGQVQVDAAAEFVIVRERRMRDGVTLRRAEEMLVNQVADGDLPPVRAGVGQFRGDAAREITDLLVRALRIELFVRVFAGELVLTGSLFLSLKGIRSEPDPDCDPESDERSFDEQAISHNDSSSRFNE